MQLPGHCQTVVITFALNNTVRANSHPEQIFRKQRLNGSLLIGNSSGRSANYSAKGQGYQEQRIEIERIGRWHLIEHKK